MIMLIKVMIKLVINIMGSFKSVEGQFIGDAGCILLKSPIWWASSFIQLMAEFNIGEVSPCEQDALSELRIALVQTI